MVSPSLHLKWGWLQSLQQFQGQRLSMKILVDKRFNIRNEFKCSFY